MRVKSLRLLNFTKHKNTHIELPEHGVVAVTGPNGSGKSSVVEGVATGGWGESLRGTSCWREGENGAVEVRADEVDVRRARAGGKTVMEWKRPGAAATTYETTTKAQEALEAVIGSFDVWRRTSVFSSQDAAHFTLARDSDRKRLLESLLDLDRFDDALARAREAKKAAEQDHATLTSGLASLKAKLESETLRVRDADMTVRTLPDPVDVKALTAQCEKLKDQLAKVSTEIQNLIGNSREADRAVANAQASARESARRLAELDVANCDSCGQPIPQTTITRLREKAEMDKSLVAKAVEKAATVKAEVEEQLLELQEERDAFSQKVFEVQAKISAERTNATQRKQAEELLKNAQQAAQALKDRIEKGTTMVAAAEKELQVLMAVEVVLGLKGVRAHVLGKALSGLETVANSWLQRIAGAGLALSLKPYSEKKTGGVSDAISLEISGAGGGLGYKAASGGERRRLDVALLLALAEVAAAAHGREPGTLFLDECMDSLDQEGIVAVAKALRELGEERCVVVITHETALVEELRPVLHLKMENGALAA